MRRTPWQALLPCLLSAGFLACGCSFSSYLLPNGRYIDPTELRPAVALAIVWQKYWVLGESRQQIEGQAGKLYPARISSSSPSAEISVYLDELRWRVDLTSSFRSGDWYPWCIDTEPVIFDGEGGKTITIEISMKDIRKVCRPPEDFARVSKLVHSVLDQPETEQFLVEQHATRAAQGTLWISPRVPGYPYVYYYVQDVPYIGIISFDDRTWAIDHDELRYIDENQIGREYRHIVERLKKEGKNEVYTFRGRWPPQGDQ